MSATVDLTEKTSSDGTEPDETMGYATANTDPTSSTRTTVRARHLRWWILMGILVAVAIAAGAGANVLHTERGDVVASVDDAATATKVASDGAVAILSYKPDTVDADLAAAKSLLTGDFLDYYNDFTTTVVAPASKEKKVATTATVPAAGAVSVSDSTAVVLVMVNQQTTTAEAPTPVDSASSVRVELLKQDGRWLISKFDPV